MRKYRRPLAHRKPTDVPEMSYRGRLTNREFFIQKKDCSEKQSFLYIVSKIEEFHEPKAFVSMFSGLKQPAEHLKLFQPNAKSTADLAFIIDKIRKYCHKFGK